jgi:hypothetical protein
MMEGARAVAALGRAAGGVAEVFRPNATEALRLAAEAREAALGQLGTEFERPARGPFDRAVDGLNRLPRPLLAFGTLALFGYAMAEPAGFSRRMAGLAHVPEPLWWLLGAIVGFYFGAREMHHARRRPRPAPPPPEPRLSAWRPPAEPAEGSQGGTPAKAAPPAPPPARARGDGNAALEAWRATR